MRTAIDFILRTYSYLYHLLLSLFLIGLAYVAMSSGKALQFGPILPWEGDKLNDWVLGLGICGVVSVILCATGLFRYLFPVWAFFIAVVMARGFFATPFNFGSASNFHGAIWLTVGALGAFLSSLMALKRNAGRR